MEVEEYPRIFKERGFVGQHHKIQCIYTQSTVLVPSSELGPPTPSLSNECVPPSEPKGGVHTRLRVRGGGPDSDDCMEKSLALSLLCGQH